MSELQRSSWKHTAVWEMGNVWQLTKQRTAVSDEGLSEQGTLLGFEWNWEAYHHKASKRAYGNTHLRGISSYILLTVFNHQRLACLAKLFHRIVKICLLTLLLNYSTTITQVGWQCTGGCRKSVHEQKKVNTLIKKHPYYHCSWKQALTKKPVLQHLQQDLHPERKLSGKVRKTL